MTQTNLMLDPDNRPKENDYYHGGRRVSDAQAKAINSIDFLGLSGGTWSPVNSPNRQFAMNPRRENRMLSGSEGYQALAMSLMDHALNRDIERGSNFNQYDVRSQQQDLINQLKGRAAGNVPSAAEMQMRRGLERSNAMAMGQAKSAYGVNPALAMRAAMNAQSQNSQATIANLAMLRAQEQAQAESALANALSGQRSQDAQQYQFDIDSRLREEEMRDRAMMGYYGGGADVFKNDVQAGVARDEMALKAHEGYQERALKEALANASARNKSQKSWLSKIL